MTKQVSFEGAQGDRLAGRLELPADGAPIAYALFAHCFTCGKNIRAAGNISRAMVQAGIGVLRFDFTGLGESEGDFADTHFSSNVADLVAAARFLKEKYEAPKILVGHSLGGAAVLMAAHELESVDAVATIGAPCRPDHVRHLLATAEDEIRERGEAEVVLAGRPFTIRKEFLDDLEEHHMQEVIAGLGRALLVMHAPMDQIVGIENAAEIFQHARHPKSFISLDTADHLLMREEDSRYAGAVVAAWAARYVGQPQKVQKAGPPDDNRIVAETGAGGFRTDILANGHALVADEPIAVGGENLGPSPYDLLVAALGACTSMTLQMYAKRKGWPLETARTRLLHTKVHARDCATCEETEGKIDHIVRELELVGDLDDEQRARLAEIADRCPVHRTLESHTHITTELRPAGA
ncbi:bifunctional alpha/beta hydrolase/OsmC family protein [soil metagenome]